MPRKASYLSLNEGPRQVSNVQNDVNVREKNRRHWDEILDPQNLEKEGAVVSLEDQLALTATADVREAMLRLEPFGGRRTLDLGGGLGLMAILMRRRGGRVTMADISVHRLKEARRMVQSAPRQAGHLPVHFVCCAAEELPFRDGAFHRQITKAVLIHTELGAASAELARTLDANGRAAFLEPTTSNPFVNLYRRLGAPGIWKEITNYFDGRSVETVEAAYQQRGFKTERGQKFLLGFFATPFSFLLPNPRLYKIAETFLCCLDSFLFRLLPVTKRLAWFVLVAVIPKDDPMK